MEMALDPDRYMVERRELRDKLERAPGVSIAGSQHFRQLERSAAACDVLLIPSKFYIKVRATTGPLKGSEGWACDSDVQPVGYWVM
jgi:hypothetical protein